MTPPAAGAVRGRAQVAPGRARPRPVTPPRQRPRRISGPARPPARRPTQGRPATAAAQPQGIAVGLLDAFETVSTHRLLDRLIRSRAWIGLIAFALIGIVALQLGLLKLNSGIGRSLEREALLQRENASLSIENSELASGDRVEEQAKRLGMALVSPEALRFLAAHPRADAAHAASALQTPVQSEAAEAASGAQAGAEGSSESGSEAESTGAGGSESAGASSESEAGAGEQTSEAGEAAGAPSAGREEPSSSSAQAPVETASTGGGTQAAPGP